MSLSRGSQEVNYGQFCDCVLNRSLSLDDGGGWVDVDGGGDGEVGR